MSTASKEPEPTYTRSCEGYVYFADQGIEVCETCGGCTCCDYDDVDHRKARYRCLLDREGKKCLLGKSSKLNHDCERDQQPRPVAEDAKP
jgi:hypothetical protein